MKKTLIVTMLIAASAASFADDVSYDTGAIFAQCVGAYKSTAEYAERKGEKNVAENYMSASRGATIAARYMFNTHISDEGHEPDAEAVSDLIENIAYGMYTRINSLWDGGNGDEIGTALRTCVEYNGLQAQIVQELRKASIGGK
jgi:hypothetical protein